MTNETAKKTTLDFINASILPGLILVLYILSQTGGAPVLPDAIQSLLIPTFPPALPPYLAYLEIAGVFAIGLICLNNIRWPIQIALYLGFGWLASATYASLFSCDLANPFSLASTAWYGTAMVVSWRNKLGPVFLPKLYLPGGILLIGLYGLNIALNYLLLNPAPQTALLSWHSAAIGISTGLAGTLIAGLIFKKAKLPAKKIVFRTIENRNSNTKKTAKPSVAQPVKSSPRPKPSKETGKLLSHADLREIKSPRKKGARVSAKPAAGARVSAKPAAGARGSAKPAAGARGSAKPAAGARGSAKPAATDQAKANPDDDWLNKHLNALDMN